MPAVIAVLLALAKGALQYLGGQAMKSIMGNPDLRDIERVVRSAIDEINASTRIAIDENEIRQLIQSMEAIFSNLRDYAELKHRKDQLDNEFLITDAILKTNDAAFQCASLKIPAILCFANAVSLNLLARSAFYKLHATPESKLLIGRMAEESATKAIGIVDPFIASLDPSVRLAIPTPHCDCGAFDDFPGKGRRLSATIKTSLNTDVVDEGPEIQTVRYCKCWVLIDGNQVKVGEGRENTILPDYPRLVEVHRQELAAYRDKAVADIQSPVYTAIAAWRSAKDTAITMALDINPQQLE
jgi:hypothetical protein